MDIFTEIVENYDAESRSNHQFINPEQEPASL